MNIEPPLVAQQRLRRPGSRPGRAMSGANSCSVLGAPNGGFPARRRVAYE